ncbi:MAG: corrinoid protein-associated methyltransferase CpaM [Thermodesulfobacteriota bacterium]
MLSYVFMKILEGRPRSYDRTMNAVSGGRVRAVKEKIASMVAPGARVLEMGCGTGELASLLLAAGAAEVLGFDQSPAMAAQSRERIVRENLGDRFQVMNMGVDGMDALASGSFDAVFSTLVMSELSDDERRFTLRQAFRALRPGGSVVLADEVVPRTPGKKALHQLARAPLVAATFLATGSTTRPLADLAGDLRQAGFVIENEERSHGDAFAVVSAKKPDVA